jgi:plastocyanin
VADPEQIYSEVLAEEQGKGVTAAVAEGRAKAARARAEQGSPHPKEPKWWPGSQPHLEGGGGEEAAEEEVAEEPAAEGATAEAQTDEVEQEAPAAPEPTTEEPAAPAAAGTPEPAPAPAAPAPQATPQEPAATATQPAAAASATQTVVPKTTGVSHGTATGTRLRPEDEVATDAQFEGQKAMYERRKLIDELVATGVPAVSANETDRSRGPWLAVLYLLIPLLVVFYLATQEEEPATEPASDEVASEAPEEGGGGGGPTTEIVAADIAWSEDSITLTADEPTTLDVINEDTTVHNLSIYETPEDAETQSNPLFEGPDVAAGETATYEIDPLKAGEYAYICDYHVNMQGTATVE